MPLAHSRVSMHTKLSLQHTAYSLNMFFTSSEGKSDTIALISKFDNSLVLGCCQHSVPFGAYVALAPSGGLHTILASAVKPAQCASIGLPPAALPKQGQHLFCNAEQLVLLLRQRRPQNSRRWVKDSSNSRKGENQMSCESHQRVKTSAGRTFSKQIWLDIR